MALVVAVERFEFYRCLLGEERATLIRVDLGDQSNEVVTEVGFSVLVRTSRSHVKAARHSQCTPGPDTKGEDRRTCGPHRL